jgi:hemolysin III
MPADTVPPPKPRMRGRFHQVAFFASIPAGVALVLLAPNAKARVAVIIFAVALAGLYGSSASYHRLHWSPQALLRMKRLDHSMIFVLIAGTYTPFSLLVLHGVLSIVMLCLVWAGALAGIVMKLVRIDGLKVLTGIMYISLGWVAVIGAPQMFHGLSGVMIALLFVGGLLYSLGALVLATRKPDPNPRVFGYHEVWHSMVIGGGICHYCVILMVVIGLRS